MADAIGPLPARDWTPGLQLLVFDPSVVGNDQVEKVELNNADAGARLAESIDAAIGDAWRTGGAGGGVTEAYVDAQFQVLIDLLDEIMNP